MEFKMKLLKSNEVAERLRSSLNQFKAVIKHQPNFPKPIKLTPKSHPLWRDSDIDKFIAAS